jgi:hypothetical protein
VDHPPNFYDEASLSEACCPVFENSIGFVSYSEQHDDVFVFVLVFDWFGGTSSAGLELKKPVGLSEKPIYEVGMTGQSSGRGIWWWPIVYHTTMSVLEIGRSASVHAVTPSPP